MRFSAKVERLLIKAAGDICPAMTLMDLAEHQQRHRQVVALVEFPVNRNRALGCRHAVRRTAIGEGAIGDGKVGEQARLKTEVADTPCHVETAAANLNRTSRIGDRVEHRQIGIAAAGGIQQVRAFRCRDASLDDTDRFGAAAKAGKRHGLGVQRFGRDPHRLPLSLWGLRRIGRNAIQGVVRRLEGAGIVSHAEGEVAAFL
ncbi:hypothetical protein D9M70_438990 [compost metagenome]